MIVHRLSKFPSLNQADTGHIICHVTPLRPPLPLLSEMLHVYMCNMACLVASPQPPAPLLQARGDRAVLLLRRRHPPGQRRDLLLLSCAACTTQPKALPLQDELIQSGGFQFALVFSSLKVGLPPLGSMHSADRD